MLQQLRISIILLALMTVLTGGVYPAIVTIIAQTVFPDQANGSLIVANSQVVGSDLIGQPFSRPEYFWGRLSATTPMPYNAASSSGSNLGPLHPDLVKNAQGRLDELREADPDVKHVPVDLVTSSASGIDPHISPAAAEIQVHRVAKARQMSEDDVRTLVLRHTAGRQFGILGEPVVKVLPLNLDLDQAQRK